MFTLFACGLLFGGCLLFICGLLLIGGLVFVCCLFITCGLVYFCGLSFIWLLVACFPTFGICLLLVLFFSLFCCVLFCGFWGLLFLKNCLWLLAGFLFELIICYNYINIYGFKSDECLPKALPSLNLLVVLLLSSLSWPFWDEGHGLGHLVFSFLFVDLSSSCIKGHQRK